MIITTSTLKKLTLRARAYLKRIFINILKAIHDLFSKDLDYLAAAISFFTLISIVPLLLVMTTILSFLPFKTIGILSSFQSFFPAETFTYISKIVNIFTKQRKLYGLLSFIVAYYSATGVFRILHRALVVIFEVPLSEHKKNLKVQFLSIPIFMLGLFGIYFGSNSISFIFALLYKIPMFNTVLSTFLASLFINIANIISFMSFFFLMFLIYHVMAPRENKKKRNSIAMAIIVSILFTALRNLFHKLVIGIAAYNPLFGAFSGLVAFLAWLFISYNLILVGARTLFYLETENKENSSPD
jgi:membrane protein